MKDGGPAFPIQASEAFASFDPAQGMSLRDYFAAKALQGYLASIGEGGRTVGNERLIAKHMYAMADAMIEASHEGAT